MGLPNLRCLPGGNRDEVLLNAVGSDLMLGREV